MGHFNEQRYENVVKFIHVSWVNTFLALNEESGHFTVVLLSLVSSFFKRLNVYIIIILFGVQFLVELLMMIIIMTLIVIKL